jgi:hypothetical protein
MSPIGTDPASSHFMVTTIDDRRTNLLEKFCDPSTGTGQALMVDGGCVMH